MGTLLVNLICVALDALAVAPNVRKAAILIVVGADAASSAYDHMIAKY